MATCTPPSIGCARKVIPLIEKLGGIEELVAASGMGG
jgi:hypothetical protein